MNIKAKTARRSLWGSLAAALALPALLLAGAPAGHFVASGGVVSDTATGLQWQQAASASDLTWTAAASYCQTLALSGGGWRLPSMKEIQTLVVEAQTHPALDTAFFSEAAGHRFWTSSQPAGVTDRAWLFDSNIGHAYRQETHFEVRARCVR